MRLRLTDVTVRYGSRNAVREVSANIDGGKVVVLLGPNASGKTTLLRTIAGLQIPSSGLVELDGANITKLKPHDRASRLAWVPSVAEVSSSFTLRRVVELGRYALGPSRQRVEDALAKVDLLNRSETLWYEASAGMRQRTAIARALAQRTPGGVLVLDEPTSALDLRHLRMVGDLLRQCASEGDIVVAAVHNIPFALDIGDEVLVLREGQLVLAGATGAVLTPGSLGDVFGVDLAWATDDAGNRHLVQP
ncbi:MAG TPA: ABC transporter ATP-binding protein [Phycisphaerales bacterium]|nr:ABC transporter ATP-binding protein [Phycisphaerales bacterium]HIB50671.1 ABC transporter ATP-binding protein [Phycisphaerales bacterium]HIN84443.1 ABC transporter ATP-binding protein [Phycisphaerales bacterium]HIO20238.1 ABC transporter ATP-binding protein [Phycisphaerales bacterium]HIO52787.1 ABC transporter ATP-binding protein [Phycisphaerales bacterium]